MAKLLEHEIFAEISGNEINKNSLRLIGHQVERFHPHQLRHSFASVALTHGADVVSVSQKLGHSDTAVTLRVYARANAESVEAVSELFREAVAK